MRRSTKGQETIARKSLVHTVLVLSIGLLASCATTPGELSPRIPPEADPADGPSVTLRSVEDARRFHAGADVRPDLHGIQDSSELEDRARLAHVVGAALEDGAVRRRVTLADGRTVEGVVRELLTASFRRAGLRVTAPGTSDGAVAPDVRARVDELWISDDGHSFYRGLRITLIEAPPPLPDGHVIEVEGANLHLPVVSRGSWDALFQAMLDQAMEALVRDLRRGRSPSTAFVGVNVTPMERTGS